MKKKIVLFFLGKKIVDRFKKPPKTPNVSPSGYVRGFHRGCPAVENEIPKPLGTYALIPDGEGGVMCEKCGETDLVPINQMR